MDVRCEKCQTEYELDEARLKPGGVTVKCTNCGHMFKIRKRSNTNVGAPAAIDPAAAAAAQRSRPVSSRPPPAPYVPPTRADSILDEAPTKHLGDEGPTTLDRQWLIRLENGEQKACRELATLQQWIVGGVISRESLISRTGKTWKRLGDIAELAQYFDIADEARTTREDRKTAPPPHGGRASPPSNPPTPPPTPPLTGRGTMLGVGGGTALPDEEVEGHTTGTFRTQPAPTPAPPPAPPPKAVKTPPLGSATPRPPAPPSAPPAPPSPPAPPAIPMPAMASTAMQPAPPELANRASTATPAPKRNEPLPPQVPQSFVGFPEATANHGAASGPAGGRATAAWATEAGDPSLLRADAGPSGPTSGPFRGNLSASIPDEPAFAAGPGRVRVGPSDESTFETGKVRAYDDDDDVMPARRGSRAGLLILILVLLVGAATATVVYLVVIKKDKDGQEQVADKNKGSDATPRTEPADATPIVTSLVDADAVDPKQAAVIAGREELAKDDETRLRQALKALAAATEPEALAVRGLLGAAIVQSLTDRAGLVADKAEAAKLRGDAKQLLIEAQNAAEKAQKASPGDAAANVALAEVMRLQQRPLASFQRFLDAAKAAKPEPPISREIQLAEALAHVRDGKLDDARDKLAALDKGDHALEKSGDVRPRFQLAMVAYLQNKPGDAKPLVEQVLAAHADHVAAKALAAKLDTLVAKTDPLPPEDGKGSAKDPKDPGRTSNKPDVNSSPGDTYETLVGKADKISNTNCASAQVLYQKALDMKPTGVEALVGYGYCLLNARSYFTAQSKFRTALAIKPGYEPALAGIAEAYQQQGKREEAIDAWKRYLDVYPGSQKGKRQLELLGASGEGGTPTPGSAAPPPGSESAPPPTPPPAPPAGEANGDD
ncbi:MAG: zinc-ribbon domain-containing protein [Deltaproteobacteria bacterium]|nr:zinc-ribbon domain-containing protein [Deltaproteobacteria bacterium]